MINWKKTKKMTYILDDYQQSACIGFWRQGATMEEIVYALDCSYEAARRVLEAYKEKLKEEK